MEVPGDLATALSANPRAKAAFQVLTSANRYSILYRIGNAKKPETRSRRIAQLVEMLARGETVHPRLHNQLSRRPAVLPRRKQYRVGRSGAADAPADTSPLAPLGGHRAA
ncbi:MAG: YdeI/OmpD-associated family protein [Acidimicrobiales bacterium]